MHIMRYTAAGVLVVLVAVVGCAARSDPSAQSHIVSDKLRHTRALEQQARERNTHGVYISAAVRPETERDLGHRETLMFLKNINFRIFGKIGYKAESLIVSAHAKNPSHPVIMDDPQSFDLTVMSGKVIVSGELLTELMNTHVFNFEGAPLRNLQVQTKPDLLVMAGQMNRHGKWVPFTMEGALSVVDNETLAFTPTNTLIEGKAANAMLEAANINLDEVITLKAPGITLTKSTIYLKPSSMFPPPALSLSIKSVTVEHSGLVLEGASKIVPAFPEPLAKSDSYIIIRGGDVKFLNMMPVNVLMQIMSTNASGPLDFSLYDYREQLAAGHLNFRQDGGVLVYLKNYDEIKVGEASR